jgi:hypothetical protein
MMNYSNTEIDDLFNSKLRQRIFELHDTLHYIEYDTSRNPSYTYNLYENEFLKFFKSYIATYIKTLLETYELCEVKIVHIDSYEKNLKELLNIRNSFYNRISETFRNISITGLGMLKLKAYNKFETEASRAISKLKIAVNEYNIKFEKLHRPEEKKEKTKKSLLKFWIPIITIIILALGLLFNIPQNIFYAIKTYRELKPINTKTDTLKIDTVKRDTINNIKDSIK